MRPTGRIPSCVSSSGFWFSDLGRDEDLGGMKTGAWKGAAEGVLTMEKETAEKGMAE